MKALEIMNHEPQCRRPEDAAVPRRGPDGSLQAALALLRQLERMQLPVASLEGNDLGMLFRDALESALAELPRAETTDLANYVELL